MKFIDLLTTSRSTIIAQKMRTALSMLWIIIWVITIILVSAIGSGAQKQVQAQFKNLSVNTIMLFPMRWLSLSQEDVDLVKQSANVASAAWFYQWNSSISSASTTSSFAILWITSDMFNIVSLNKQAGELIDDTMEKDKNVLLWYGVFTQLFPDTKPEDVVWQTVSINKKEFTIIWVLKKAWWWFGPLSFDDSAYVPLKSFEKYIATSARNSPQLRITALAKDTPLVSKAVEEITTIINEKYKLESTDNKFRVIDAGSTVSTAQESAKTLKYLLIGIASIVFLVSWIGIMNVMFASVAERTKEIGILKSIGADQWSILNQFLLESLILTWFGSLIGAVLGELVIWRSPFGTTLPLERTLSGDLISIVFAMITGLFFGRYPARKASKMDPVDALRS